MKRTLALVLGVVAVIASACGGSTPAASAAPSAAASATVAAKTASPSPTARPVTKLVAAYSNITGDNWVMWYAFEKGFFKANGLDVTLQSISGGSQTSAALVAKQVEVAQFGGSEALSANVQGGDLVMVGQMAPVYPYILYTRKDIKTVADLKGKKIGVSNPGGSSDIATRAALKAEGLDPDKDVLITSVGSHSARTAALLSGAIDAGVDDPPEDEALVKAGMNPLIDLAALKLPAANTGIIVQRSWLSTHKDAMQAYIDATVQARAKMASDKAGSIEVLNKYFKKLEASATDHAYKFFIASATPVTPIYPVPAVEQLKPAVEVLKTKNAKVTSYDISTMIDASFVKSAQDRKLGG